MRGDNIGDSISPINPYLNEHTVIYNVIRNPDLYQLEDEDYIGFCHYRRFFGVSTNE